MDKVKVADKAAETFAEKMKRPEYRAAFAIKNTILNREDAYLFHCGDCGNDTLGCCDENAVVECFTQIIREEMEAEQTGHHVEDIRRDAKPGEEISHLDPPGCRRPATPK